MRVELLGPSGVGKTTVLQSLKPVLATRPDMEWLGPASLDKIAAENLCCFSAKERMRLALDEFVPRAFIDTCFRIVTASSMLPSQKVAALTILRKSCEASFALRSMDSDTLCIHDELLLHRSISLLPLSADLARDASEYFHLVPVPDIACIVRADVETIVQRALLREHLPNCYFGQDEGRMRQVIGASLKVCDAAATVLSSRGVRVIEIDTSAHPGQVSQQFASQLGVI
ncbi:hypothetical protein [Luteimonas sp. R10]|uniref:hypothetical protein n=1 Tax=Luteimonas sp. R10 TaxID=3108176 RepID=UPI00308C9F6B|nr:hypothetical protein U3649_17975 [Luteimonas sp. R10]